jgi:hypothetical protein
MDLVLTPGGLSTGVANLNLLVCVVPCGAISSAGTSLGQEKELA